MPVRIYDIAKKLGIETRVVLAKAKELGIEARVPSSSLDKVTAEYIENQLEGELSASFHRGLRSLGLGNFKAFADTQSIPIRPLTLIFGANSSGKSSVIHGLLLAHQSLVADREKGSLDVTRTEIGGDSVDLGGFRQFIHRRDASRRGEWSAELDTGTLRGPARSLLDKLKVAKLTLSFGVPLDDKGHPVPQERPRLISYQIEGAGRTLLRLSRRPDGTMHLDRVDNEVVELLVQAVLGKTTTERIEPGNELTAVRRAVGSLVPTLRFKTRGVLPEGLLGEEYTTSAPPQLLAISRGNRVEELVAAARLVVPWNIAEVVRGFNTALRAQLARIRYLGPLRSFPPRHLAFVDDQDRNWFAGGGYAWDVVRTNEEVRDDVNRWLGSEALQTRYQLRIRSLTPVDVLEQPLGDAIEGIPIEVIEEGYGPGHDSEGREHDGEPPVFGIKDPHAEAQDIVKSLHERVSERFDELVLMDLRTSTPVTHRDVGIGVSQVLPVLVHAYADQGQIVAIEQPEIHLHPALQADLGDLFIEAALGDLRNTFLLETHSEHLILRILRRVRETTENPNSGKTPVRPEDVTVVFVEPTAKGSVVRHLPVTPDGDFGAQWPGGFFAERFQDLP